MSNKKRYRCQYKNLEPLWISASSTCEAGRLASEEYASMGYGVIDEFTIDVVEAGAAESQTQFSEFTDSIWDDITITMRSVGRDDLADVFKTATYGKNRELRRK